MTDTIPNLLLFASTVNSHCKVSTLVQNQLNLLKEIAQKFTTFQTLFRYFGPNQGHHGKVNATPIYIKINVLVTPQCLLS